MPSMLYWQQQHSSNLASSKTIPLVWTCIVIPVLFFSCSRDWSLMRQCTQCLFVLFMSEASLLLLNIKIDLTQKRHTTWLVQISLSCEVTIKWEWSPLTNRDGFVLNFGLAPLLISLCIAMFVWFLFSITEMPTQEIFARFLALTSIILVGSDPSVVRNCV